MDISDKVILILFLAQGFLTTLGDPIIFERLKELIIMSYPIVFMFKYPHALETFSKLVKYLYKESRRRRKTRRKRRKK